MGPGFHHYYDGLGPGAGWVWGLLMLLFWAAVIVLIVWAVLRLTRPDAPLGRRSEPPRQHGTAREILDRRYASGEIDAAAYDEMRSRLEGPPPPDRPGPPPS